MTLHQGTPPGEVPVVTGSTAGGRMSLAHVEPTWRAAAACQGATAVHFYPPATIESREARATRETSARQLCAACHVRDACLEYALYVQEPYGIWGGLTEAERRRLMRAPAR